jgi:hypothetical protein
VPLAMSEEGFVPKLRLRTDSGVKQSDLKVTVPSGASSVLLVAMQETDEVC